MHTCDKQSKNRQLTFLGLAIAITVFMACAPVGKHQQKQDLKWVGQKSGTDLKTVSISQDKDKRGPIALGEISLAGAMEIALRNNPTFQIIQKDMAKERAEHYIESSLENPVIEGHLFFNSGTSGDIALLQGLNNWLILPFSRKAAKKETAALRYYTARKILVEALTVKRAYLNYQASIVSNILIKGALTAAELHIELITNLNRAGNLNELEKSLATSELVELKAELEESLSIEKSARMDLMRLMGLNADATFSIPDRLPPLPDKEASLESLQAMVVNRSDVMGLKQNISAAKKKLKIARFKVMPELRVGAVYDLQDEAVGPAFEIEIPIFNWNRVGISAAKNNLQSLEHQYKKKQLDVVYDVKMAHNNLLVSRKKAEHYRNIILPLRALAVAEAQKHYNYMLIGLDHLLEIKRHEWQSKREMTETLEKYWNFRIDLELAMGGRLIINFEELNHEKYKPEKY